MQFGAVPGNVGTAGKAELMADFRPGLFDERLRAARELASVADGSSIVPLIEKLRGTFSLRSAWMDMAVRMAVMASKCLFIICTTYIAMGLVLELLTKLVGFDFIEPLDLILGPILALVWLGTSGLICVRFIVTYRGYRSEFCQVLLEALDRVLESSPNLAAQELLPDLRAISLDHIQYQAGTRTAAARVRKRVTSLKMALGTLPKPSNHRANGSENLPRRARADLDTVYLPRARTQLCEGDDSDDHIGIDE